MSRQSYQHSQSKHGADNSTFVNSNTMNLHNTVNSLNKRPFPAFLLKLYKLLEDNNNSDIVSWSLDGNSFIIKDIHKFSSQILPKYFKHKNFPSFHRQVRFSSLID